MKTGNDRRIFLALLIIWFIINTCQAFFTEIMWDEAYYGLYGKYLAWGYFDHPPMIALLVKISSLFFSGNLGVRFMTVVMQLGTLLLTWSVIDRSKPEKSQVLFFFIVAASMTMFSAYGFITTPDAPLLFFTALFLYGYRDFLRRDDWRAVIILSVSMAGLVYSKYQAVLVIGFVILSNLKILKSFKFWIAGITAIILLSPHFTWQVLNDFPTFKYHLIDRSVGFRWKFLLEYIPNQLAVFNPFILGAVIYILIKYRASDLFERALWFLIIGFTGFFWLTSARGHVEPHWTVACSVAIIILLISKTGTDKGLRRYIIYFVAPSLILILLVRISLLTNMPVIKRVNFNGKKEKIDFIESVTKELPVVFISSFQYPALFSFFTGKEAFPVSTILSRQTQYDILQLERNYQNKAAFIVFSDSPGSVSYEKDGFKFKGFMTDSLQTTNRLKIEFGPLPGKTITGDTLSLSFSVNNPGDNEIDFNHSRFPVEVCAAYIKGRETHIVPVGLSEPVTVIAGGQTVERTLTTCIPDLPSGTYQFGITLRTVLGATLNSSFTKITVNGHD